MNLDHVTGLLVSARNGSGTHLSLGEAVWGEPALPRAVGCMASTRFGPRTPSDRVKMSRVRKTQDSRSLSREPCLRTMSYVQQLESSRMKLTQLEQELQRARTQGMFFGGSDMLGDQCLPCGSGNLSTVEAAVFDMEYARCLEEHHRLMCELRAAVSEHLLERDMVARADVFHLASGVWKTPAERCFLWMGGFRPSDLLKMLVPQIEPLTEQQFLAMCSLQKSSQQAEDALTQGIEGLHQSLSETIASDCHQNIKHTYVIGVHNSLPKQEKI
ncbi:hypothetical protein AMTRI_Chr07g27440 [Amborella trichopoda]